MLREKLITIIAGSTGLAVPAKTGREIRRAVRKHEREKSRAQKEQRKADLLARKEFEEARHERDPLIVARLLVVGRQCVLDTQVKFNAMEDQMRAHVERTRKR